MNRPEFKTEELITAAEASLKKWSYPKLTQLGTSNKCGFCNLMISKKVHVSMSSEQGYPAKSSCFEPCPVGIICHTNIVFWDEIYSNDRKDFNPDKYKYQKRRIQKNIDWLNDYLKELQK